MRDQKSSALKHWLVDAIKSPWRFTLIVGALSFGGLTTAYLIATGSSIDTAAPLGIVAGLVGGSVVWLALKIANPK